MDERESKTPQRKPPGPGAHPAPVAVDGPVAATSTDQTDAPANPYGERSHVVYSDDEAEVMKGFAIALRAMGLG
ncbi:MAG: hypothetical protein ACRED3_05085 [Bradyrhizobium sp.]